MIKEAIPTKSFFTFFSPPKTPSEDDDLPDNEQDKIEQHHKLERRLMGKVRRSIKEYYCMNEIKRIR
ncbi:hypothetical protein CROQUDRAFT_663454 [Cronartium quercuum f. sp. fusiforme G11]|uniref:Uncharacterized protein n=1 Tax=Cronartium quercuum f. sp. fusiforme G11 TaxID=708437 RepID=A0A9P6NCH4_9BASI|nr:hypothetical protein CROQUDRAFT_663454 [Cronartium quercuum f. sp. fusiforme G11]